MIKCVVWDLDNTLLAGVYLESPGQPPAADPVLAAVLAELARRGILQAIASRNPPEACQHASQVTGHAFAAVRCGWGAKSAAIAAIMTELDLAADELAFVDDDALERAEVSFGQPGVLVLSPQDMADAASWPQFRPPVVTDEARRRGELYVQRQARQEEARAFGGSREDFLRYCQTEVTIGQAVPSDLPRLHELSVRTHQFNSAGTPVSEAGFAAILGSPGHRLITVRLRDRFGDDGLVGGCVVETPAGSKVAWEVSLLMVSCRAMGRGIIEALLGWTCLTAADAKAGQVAVRCVITPRNVPLRIALTGAGFRAEPPAGDVSVATYRRQLDQPLPDLPGWVIAEVRG